MEPNWGQDHLWEIGTSAYHFRETSLSCLSLKWNEMSRTGKAGFAGQYLGEKVGWGWRRR